VTPNGVLSARPRIDVAGLPPSAFDSRAPVWWGNTLMVLIETTTVLLAIVTYFYIRQNFDAWPPPRGDVQPAMFHPVPDLPAGTANAILLALSLVPMILVDRAARPRNEWMVKAGLLVLCGVSIAALVLRVFEFPALHVRWDDNAYGSVAWGLVVLHAIYLVLAAAEVFIVTLWVFLHDLDEKHAMDVTLTATYWYWTVGTWLVLYAIVYWAPRVI
jgi:cytochrome c oxidase subunit III